MNLFLAILIAPQFSIIAIIIVYYLIDKKMHKSKKLMAIAFIFGILSALLGLVIELGLSILTKNLTGWILIVVDSFIIAGLVEESSKFLFFMVSIWKRKSFKNISDGILYMVTLSLGFAAIENVFYGISYDLLTILLRSITAIPGHAIFGGIMGYFIGKAKSNREKRNSYLLIGLSLAILLHGFYDFFATISSIILAFIVVLIIYIILGVIILFLLIKKALKEDSNLQINE